MNKRQMIIDMIAEIDGGREVVAAYLGMTTDALNNRIYEKKGQSVSFDDLLRIQELSNTNLLAQFCLPKEQVIVKEPSAADCDTVELTKIMIKRQGAHGELQAFLHYALSDDCLTSDEKLKIEEMKKEYFSLVERELIAVDHVYGERK